MPHDVRMNPLLDQSLFGGSLDEAINGLGCEPFLLVWTMFPKCLEEGMAWVCAVPGGLQVVLDGEKGPGVQGDAAELLTLPDDINDGLVPIGPEIADLEAADFGFS